MTSQNVNTDTFSNISIDIETFSDADLKKCGVYKYAESPNFEILLFAYSLDNGPVQVIDLAQGEEIPESILAALSDNRIEKWAYNASFERICLSEYLRKHHPEHFVSYSIDGDTVSHYLDPSAWKCSRIWGAYMGLPLSLEGIGAVLKLQDQKMKEGKDLIRYFCVPCKPTKTNGGRERNLPEHAPDKWDVFKSYNIRDVEVELAIKDKLRLFGELITSNLYMLDKGSVFYEVVNYYDNMNTVRIPCNPALSPKENANKYYKDYRKAQKAEVMLQELIRDGEAEIVYIESVLDELSRADTESELSQIRQELCLSGYLKNKSGKKAKPPKELPPIEFKSSDGYTILVGRNNIQNDKLSMKLSNNNDMWLHTQKVPGSHVIIKNIDGKVSDLSIEEASSIAAYYSKARESSLVEVDYTNVRHLKKPVGAKPGKVIYHEYYSLIAKPDKALVDKLFVK